MPKGLPPARAHDHTIHLQPGSLPPNIRPYRYPYAQKSEIELLVAEMLEACIIQPSQSAYSAPVVMVLRKDHAWRMCPDYRELNRMTIKDKFPIPVIDELLDELQGSIYFTNRMTSHFSLEGEEEEEGISSSFNFLSSHLDFLEAITFTSTSMVVAIISANVGDLISLKGNTNYHQKASK